MQERASSGTGHNEGAHELLVERPQKGVGVVTMNRVAARNSLSLSMIDGLHAAVSELAEDSGVAAIVLAANGPVFSAGHDLKELSAHRADPDKGLAFFETTMERCSRMMQAIVACPKPVIAAVQGTATAAGCQLVATCDLAVAAENAEFCTPGVNIGLFCSTPMVALSRNVTRKHAMEMLLLGEMLPASGAAEYGLVNRVVPQDELMDAAISLAGKIAKKPPATVAMGKAAFYTQAEMPLSEAYAYTTKVMVENMMARDAEEGISAFLQKRKPKWKSS
ncbi:MAG: enoyl-CoA hydratase [Hyphomicrobium sp.]